MSQEDYVQLLEKRIVALEARLNQIQPRLSSIDHPMQPVFLAKKDGDKTWHEQVIVTGAAVDAPGSIVRKCTSASHPSALADKGSATVLLEVRDGANYRYVEIAPTNIVFAVYLQKTGGSAGDSTHFCTFTYSVKNINNDVIGTGVALSGRGNRIVKAQMNEATHGLAYYDLASALVLIWADEYFNQTLCT